MRHSILRRVDFGKLSDKTDYDLFGAILDASGDTDALIKTLTGVQLARLRSVCNSLFFKDRGNAPLLLQVALISDSITAAQLSIREILEHPGHFGEDDVQAAIEANKKFRAMPEPHWSYCPQISH